MFHVEHDRQQAIEADGESQQSAWEGDERGKVDALTSFGVFHVEHSWRGRTLPLRRFGRDRWIRGSRLLVSHEEQPPERIWHGNGLAPVPGWSLLDLGHVALPDP